MTTTLNTAAPTSDQLLAWYDQHRREMPWRCAPGRTPDPYHVWLSEIMLQQTTVATVGSYFEKFINRWPSLNDFAVSDLDDVLKMWAGLGYYARARNLHKCASVVMAEHGGKFPRTLKELQNLPGVGPYTAAAILSIAFDTRAVVVDGNVERVMARIFAVEKPLPRSKPLLKTYADTLTPDKRSGDYAQAVMDLGATLCKPKKPSCSICPWLASCIANKKGIQEQLPRKIKKPPKPTRHGTVFWLQRQDGKILLRKRPAKGLLGAMMEIPSTPWIDITEKRSQVSTPETHAPLETLWHKDKYQNVRHTFTHFHLELNIWQASTDTEAILTDAADKKRCSWVSINDLDDQALPTLMRKVVSSVLK